MIQPAHTPRLRRFLTRIQHVLGWLVCLFVILGIVAWAPAESAKKAKTGQAQFSLREGTRVVDQSGHFRSTGDRIVFFSTRHNTRYVVLENLNLERIANAMADQPSSRKWTVTGTLTEYHGDNYLLVEKVVLESWSKAVRHSP